MIALVRGEEEEVGQVGDKRGRKEKTRSEKGDLRAKKEGVYCVCQIDP